MRNFQTYSTELEGKELVDAIREEEPNVPIVSNSQLNTWNGCEFNFHLAYTEGWKKREEPRYLTLGSLGHAVAAEWYKTHSREAVQALLLEHFNTYAMRDAEMLTMLAEESWLIMRYIDDFVPSNDAAIQEIEAVEEHFIIALMTPKGRKFYIQGYVDLRAIVDGQRWLWDHKWSQKFMFPNEAIMDPQLPTYAAAYDAYGFPIFGVLYNQFNTYEYKKKEGVSPEQLFRRQNIYLSKAQMNNTLWEVGNAVDDMLDKTEAGVVPRRRLSRSCSRCWFQGPCLMGLQGHDLNSLLAVDFVRKGAEFDPNEGELESVELELHM